MILNLNIQAGIIPATNDIKAKSFSFQKPSAITRIRF